MRFAPLLGLEKAMLQHILTLPKKKKEDIESKKGNGTVRFPFLHVKDESNPDKA